MRVGDKIWQVLYFNDDLAFSILELLDRVCGGWRIVRYFKVLRSLRVLEKRGYVESRHIGWRKYYSLRK